MSDDRLSVCQLYEEELLLLRPSEKPVHSWRVGNIAASDLSGLPFVLYPKDSNMRQIIDLYLDRVGVTPEVAMEAADTELIVRLVEAGLGQSILPANALRRSPRYFRAARISGGRLFRQQAVATLRASSRPLTLAITQFVIDNLS
ncbi:MAG: LysR family transcriptional regulator substrate-binding protein [Acidobacteria bacterium]|nr:LysR family transcriptional regulator substrate-binding protein [Acidobacteriota bacterium]